MIQDLQNRFAAEKGFLNFKGIANGLGLHHTTLGEFVKESGYISKQAFVVVLKFALERGFKLYEAQSDYELSENELIVWVRQVTEKGITETAETFNLMDVWQVYDHERKATKTTAIPRSRQVIRE